MLSCFSRVLSLPSRGRESWEDSRDLVSEESVPPVYRGDIGGSVGGVMREGGAMSYGAMVAREGETEAGEICR